MTIMIMINNWKQFVTFYAFILWNYGTVRCDENDDTGSTTEAPKFLTKGGTFRVVIGETVTLPCQVENLGRYTIVWKRGNAVLSAGDMKVTVDPRIHLVDGFNLEIKKIRLHDAGDYICQMSTLTPEDEIYTLEILVPPTVRSEPIEDHVTLTKGDTVTLQCRGTGNPVPIITWTRKDNLLPNGEESVEGNTFKILKADRHQGGVYICSANNGVGTPVSTSIHVKVHYPPEIEVEKSWIHSGDGQEAELACIVYSEPPAVVKWYQDRNDSIPLETTDRSLFEERGTRYTLIIRLVQPSDFGNYTCVGDNKLGSSRKYIRLSGKPKRPIILSESQGTSQDSFNITWNVESFLPITEYHIKYRDQNIYVNDTHSIPPGEWNDIILPATGAVYNIRNSSTVSSSSDISKGPVVHVKSYQIKDLEPERFYESQVTVLNKYGASKPSDMFVFRTSKKVVPPFESSLQHISADPEIEVVDLRTPTSNAMSVQSLSLSLMIMSAHSFRLLTMVVLDGISVIL